MGNFQVKWPLAGISQKSRHRHDGDISAATGIEHDLIFTTTCEGESGALGKNKIPPVISNSYIKPAA